MGIMKKSMDFLGFSEEENDDTENFAYSQNSADAEIEERPKQKKKKSFFSTTAEDETSYIKISKPLSFDETKGIGEIFRKDIPVIMNLADLPDADSKKLIDFVSGLAFGLNGKLKKISDTVFLLAPSSTKVVTDEENTLE
jgi:cell division inhibitor SepF